jgi:UDP-glucose 4,6-dehydratase
MIERRLLVTGGCGFIGSNFINMWMEKYPSDKIINVDRLDECASVNNIRERHSPKYTLVVSDITNSVLMLNLLKQFEISHIVHFAAQTHVDHSFGNSLSFTHSNIVGTHSLLEAARMYGKLERFLHMSTDEVYGEIPEGAFSETSLLSPTNPYAATKAGAEFLVRSYGHSFKLPYVIVRGNNVYGPQQYPEKVIPAFTMALLRNKKMRIQGNGSAVRMFVYVSDVAEGVETVLLQGELSNIYNIGKQEQYSVMDVAKTLLTKLKSGASLEDWIEYVPDRLFNDCRYSVDTKKIEALGWSCKVSFEEGVQRTIDWYREHVADFKQA